MSQSMLIEGWVAKLAEGDEAARGELLTCAQERLLRLVRQMKRDYPSVGRWEESDDILQNTLIRLQRALESVRPKDARHFLRISAQHIRWELQDLARKYQGPHGLGRRCKASLPVGSPSSESPGAAWEPGTETDNPARVARWTELHEQIDELPDKLREVFELVFYQGLPQTEVADLLGVSTKTVNQRWIKARLALKTALDDASMLQ